MSTLSRTLDLSCFLLSSLQASKKSALNIWHWNDVETLNCSDGFWGKLRLFLLLAFIGKVVRSSKHLYSCIVSLDLIKGYMNLQHVVSKEIVL